MLRPVLAVYPAPGRAAWGLAAADVADRLVMLVRAGARTATAGVAKTAPPSLSSHDAIRPARTRSAGIGSASSHSTVIGRSPSALTGRTGPR